MSELNYLEKLLAGAEVEWKELGEVCRFINGKAYKKPELLDQGKYPVLRVGNFFTNDNWYYSDLELHEDKYCDDGDLLYAWSASFGPRIWEGGKVIYHYHIWKVIPKIEIVSKKYLFYLLDWDTEALKAEHGTGSTMMHVGKGAIEKRVVPIPPLAVQNKVVQILDTFTTLTAELTAELLAREKQYAYYLRQLLTFNVEHVEWKTLEKVSNIFDSLHQTPKYTENGLNMIRVTNIKGGLLDLTETLKVSDETFKIFTKRYAPQKFDLVMSRVGSYGNVSIVPLDHSVCMGQNTVVIHPLINKKFLYYVLSSEDVKTFIEKNVAGGSQKTLSLKVIKLIPIPIPNEKEQQRIVNILDKFDTLTTSLTEGLPREIELRQQQYEYYRELLLSFPKPEDV